MMKKTILFLTALILSACLSAFGQFGGGLNKIKDKAQEAVKKTAPNNASDGVKTDEISAAAKNGQVPISKGVEAVLTKAEYSSFAEAKSNAVNKITDGEPLWLYLKFNDSLAKYAYKSSIADDDGNIKYFLYAEIGARDGDDTYKGDALIFKKEDLNVSELKIALAPGRAGRNKSLSMFLETVGGGEPGVWNNEIRISNSPVSPRSAKDYLAKVPLTADVADGIPKYRKMQNDYFQTVSRGIAEENKLPEPGRYVNNALKAQILNKLKTEGITPVKFYFTFDDWAEYTDNNVKQNRKVYAAYTYKKGAECLYGVAEAVQDYSHLTGSYGATVIYTRNDSPIQCSVLN